MIDYVKDQIITHFSSFDVVSTRIAHDEKGQTHYFLLQSLHGRYEDICFDHDDTYQSKTVTLVPIELAFEFNELDDKQPLKSYFTFNSFNDHHKKEEILRALQLEKIEDLHMILGVDKSGRLINFNSVHTVPLEEIKALLPHDKKEDIYAYQQAGPVKVEVSSDPASAELKRTLQGFLNRIKLIIQQLLSEDPQVPKWSRQNKKLNSLKLPLYTSDKHVDHVIHDEHLPEVKEDVQTPPKPKSTRSRIHWPILLDKTEHIESLPKPIQGVIRFVSDCLIELDPVFVSAGTNQEHGATTRVVLHLQRLHGVLDHQRATAFVSRDAGNDIKAYSPIHLCLELRQPDLLEIYLQVARPSKEVPPNPGAVFKRANILDELGVRISAEAALKSWTRVINFNNKALRTLPQSFFDQHLKDVSHPFSQRPLLEDAGPLGDKVDTLTINDIRHQNQNWEYSLNRIRLILLAFSLPVAPASFREQLKLRKPLQTLRLALPPQGEEQAPNIDEAPKSELPPPTLPSRILYMLGAAPRSIAHITSKPLLSYISFFMILHTLSHYALTSPLLRLLAGVLQFSIALGLLWTYTSVNHMWRQARRALLRSGDYSPWFTVYKSKKSFKLSSLHAETLGQSALVGGAFGLCLSLVTLLQSLQLLNQNSFQMNNLDPNSIYVWWSYVSLSIVNTIDFDILAGMEWFQQITSAQIQVNAWYSRTVILITTALIDLLILQVIIQLYDDYSTAKRVIRLLENNVNLHEDAYLTLTQTGRIGERLVSKKLTELINKDKPSDEQLIRQLSRFLMYQSSITSHPSRVEKLISKIHSVTQQEEWRQRFLHFIFQPHKIASKDEILMEFKEDNYWLQSAVDGVEIASRLVTQRQWLFLTKHNPSMFFGDQRPVEQITWRQAQEACNALNQLFKDEGYHYRLPTAQEWREQANTLNLTQPITIEQTDDMMGECTINVNDCFHGNVNVWCAEEGECIGGSWAEGSRRAWTTSATLKLTAESRAPYIGMRFARQRIAR